MDEIAFFFQKLDMACESATHIRWARHNIYAGNKISYDASAVQHRQATVSRRKSMLYTYTQIITE